MRPKISLTILDRIAGVAATGLLTALSTSETASASVNLGDDTSGHNGRFGVGGSSSGGGGSCD